MSIWKKRPSLTQGKIDGEEKSSDQDPKRVVTKLDFLVIFLFAYSKSMFCTSHFWGHPPTFLGIHSFLVRSQDLWAQNWVFEIHPDEAEFRERYPPWNYIFAPENGWLCDNCFLFGRVQPGRCELLNIREGIEFWNSKAIGARWKKGSLVVHGIQGMKSYPIIWGLFHRPFFFWIIKQSGFNGKSGVPLV